MYSCRMAQSDDYNAISSFPRNAEEVFFMSPKLQYPLTAEQLIEATTDRKNLTVLLDESGLVIGYANLYNLEADERCWLGNVIVSPDYRSQGAALFLIQNMITAARHELHVDELHLVCHSSNTRALLFYTKLGFKPYDIVKRTTPDGSMMAGILMKLVK